MIKVLGIDQILDHIQTKQRNKLLVFQKFDQKVDEQTPK